MKIKINKSEGASTIALSGELTLEFAEDLKNALITSIDSSEKISIHLRDIAEADLSFLQLLCSAHKTSNEKGKRIGFSEPGMPPVVQTLMDNSGVSLNKGCFGEECFLLNKNTIDSGEVIDE